MDLFSRTFLLGLIAAAGAAHAQPVMVSLGYMGPSDMTPDASVVVGNTYGGPAQWRLTGGAPSVMLMAGATNSGVVRCSSNAQVITGSVLNASAAGSLPTDAEISGRWTAAGWQNLGVFPGATACDATINGVNGISSDGRFVVGGGWINCKYRAYIWDAASGVMTNLGVQSLNWSSRANSVSADGSTVAGFDENPSTGARRPSVWTNGVETILPTVGHPPDDGGEVLVLNDAGTIATGQSFQYPNSVVRWTKTGSAWNQQFVATATIPAWAYNYFFEPQIMDVVPTAATEDGQTIVGVVEISEPGSFPVDAGFLYTPATGLVDLTTYLGDAGAVGLETFGLAGSPEAISANGRVIAGSTLGGGNWLLYLDGAPCQAPVVSIVNSLTVPDVGGFAVLNCNTLGSVPATYEWRVNGTLLVDGPGPDGSNYYGAATDRLFIDTVSCANAGSYVCTVTNACGTATASVQVTVNGCVTCYANCDGSTTSPVLNVADFTCFLQKYAAGDAYANCDASTVPPTLNVADFTCFLQKFAAGCP